MTTQTEAMKLVLKDLERSESKLHKARAALKEALAEQANEPDWKAEAVALRVNEQNLIAALEAEREACAKVCDEFERANLYGVKECAAAIRARSNT